MNIQKQISPEAMDYVRNNNLEAYITEAMYELSKRMPYIKKFNLEMISYFDEEDGGPDLFCRVVIPFDRLKEAVEIKRNYIKEKWNKNSLKVTFTIETL